MKKILMIALLFSATAHSEDQKIFKFDSGSYLYKKPTTFEFATNFPKNSISFLDNSFRLENWKGWGAILASTALLYYYDDKITSKIQKYGRDLNLGNGDKSKRFLNIGGHSLLRLPTDAASLMYFMGDGWVTIGFSAGFLTTGLIADDPRTLQTASQLFQGLLMTGVTTQILKRVTGRETPNSRSTPLGAWRPFPKTSDFQSQRSKYDAYPSGHLASTMTSFMILAENYPEHRYIKPVGYTYMSLLAFEMVNNGVHWASDYPLALGIGYMIGKTIVDSGRKKVDELDNHHVMFIPTFESSGRLGMALQMDF